MGFHNNAGGGGYQYLRPSGGFNHLWRERQTVQQSLASPGGQWRPHWEALLISPKTTEVYFWSIRIQKKIIRKKCKRIHIPCSTDLLNIWLSLNFYSFYDVYTGNHFYSHVKNKCTWQAWARLIHLNRVAALCKTPLMPFPDLSIQRRKPLGQSLRRQT